MGTDGILKETDCRVWCTQLWAGTWEQPGVLAAPNNPSPKAGFLLPRGNPPFSPKATQPILEGDLHLKSADGRATHIPQGPPPSPQVNM